MPVPLDSRGRLDLSRLDPRDCLAQARRADLALAAREEAACRIRVPDPVDALGPAPTASWAAAREEEAALHRLEVLVADLSGYEDDYAGEGDYDAETRRVVRALHATPLVDLDALLRREGAA